MLFVQFVTRESCPWASQQTASLLNNSRVVVETCRHSQKVFCTGSGLWQPSLTTRICLKAVTLVQKLLLCSTFMIFMCVGTTVAPTQMPQLLPALRPPQRL